MSEQALPGQPCAVVALLGRGHVDRAVINYLIGGVLGAVSLLQMRDRR